MVGVKVGVKVVVKVEVGVGVKVVVMVKVEVGVMVMVVVGVGVEVDMKLNLGCSDAHIPGFINVDRVPPADKLVDLSITRWPWEDSSISEIRAHDVIEHLPDKIFTMNECWRVLIPGGLLDILVPTTDGRGAWQDPTHVSYWNRNSFFYYTHGDPHRERFGDAYGVTARFEVMDAVQGAVGDQVTKLAIKLKAVK